jgi:hypothetical protein
VIGEINGVERIALACDGRPLAWVCKINPIISSRPNVVATLGASSPCPSRILELAELGSVCVWVVNPGLRLLLAWGTGSLYRLFRGSAASTATAPTEAAASDFTTVPNLAVECLL